jgi:hypothetical protein
VTLETCNFPLVRIEVKSYPEKQALQAWRKAKKNGYQVLKG